MKRKLISLLCVLAAFSSVRAQYFGATLFTEGFDDAKFPSAWTQVNSAGNRDKWSLSSGDVAEFSKIVSGNKHSAKISVSSKDTKLTLTSPVIDATGNKDLQVGFYGNELNYAFRGGCDFRFRVSADQGETWTDLFSSASGSSFSGTQQVGQWNLYKYSLPADFDGKQIQLQFYIDASTMYNNPQALNGFIDGVFVSMLPECDPAVTAINYSTDDRLPSSGVYGTNEPLKVTVTNAGSHELASADVYYRVNGGEEIVETFTFPKPIAKNESAECSFTNGIDLSQSGKLMVITAGVRIDGDMNRDNNEIKAYVENTLTDVPYEPAFVYDDEGVTTVTQDGWTTFENNAEYGWDFESWRLLCWYVEAEMNDDPNDAYLVSRPLRLKGGTTYRLQFSAITDDNGSAYKNIMAVELGSSPKMDDSPKEIWRNDAIDDSNAANAFALFNVEKDGIYYIGFHSLSEAGADPMYLKDIAVYKSVESDVALTDVLSPASSAYTYTAEEPVKVRLTNYGAMPLSAGAFKVKVSLDGKTVLEEPVNADLASHASIDYQLSGKLDLSELGRIHKAVAEVVLEGDEDTENDRKKFEIESVVTSVPYIPDFGAQNEKGHDVDFWTAEDTNGDGYTFMARGDAQLDAYAFSYGGGMYGFTTVTLPSSDERLLSRHISMEGGKSYKFVYNARIGAENGSLPLEMNLYRITNGTKKTLVKKIHSANITSPVYAETIFDFAVEESGIYQLEFAVTDSKEIDYRMYIGGFRLTELTAKDLSVEELVIPTRYISGIHSFPVGLKLRNNGTEAVTSLTLTGKSASAGEKVTTLSDISIEPDASYLIYFPEDFVFDGEGTEDLTVSVKAEGDAYAANDSRTVTLTYCEPYSLPYSLLPEEALERSGAYNLNRDSYRFQTDRTVSTGYLYAAPDDVEANDYVATPAITLAKGDAHRLSFTYYVLEGDATDIEVFAYDAAADRQVPVTAIYEASASSLSRYIGFCEVPESGDYNICIRPRGKAKSLFINTTITLEKTDKLPDLVIGKLTTHTDSAVLTDNETVTVEFTSVAEQGVQGVPFTLKVGNKTYHSIFTSYTATNDGDSYSVSFKGVDLSEPGTYTLECSADVPMDLTPDNNKATFTVTSLPIIDLAVTGLVTPKTGKLGKEEKVTVTVANNGKGAISGFEMKCKVSGAATAELSGYPPTPLAAGETMEYTFTKTLDMFEEGVYNFEITAVVEGDVKPEDNTLKVSVNSTEKDFDAGVTAITAPVDGVFTEAESVTVTVTNFGETILFDIPVMAEIFYKHSGGVMVLTGSVASLEAGASADYTFPGTVDMKKCGEYTINAATTIADDANKENDYAHATVRCLTQDVGVTAIISPTSGEDLGVCDVIVAVTNFGEADVENIPMRYQIGSMPQLATMEMKLKAGETSEFKFPVPYEFTSYRTATVTAATMLDNDANPDNDEMSVEVENREAGVGTLTANAALYPNPAHSTVKVSADNAIVTVVIYDVEGILRAEYEGEGTEALDLDLALPAGHYITVIVTEAGTAVQRLIVI